MVRKHEMEYPVAIDIETIPDETKVGQLPEPETNARLKDPEKIKADKAEKKEKQRADMALSPFSGRLCAFAVANYKTSFSGYLSDPSDESERSLLRDIFEIFTGHSKTVASIVTFNGMSFDLPFIYGRMACLGMFMPFMPLSYWCKRYTNKPHCDLRMLLSNWDSRAKGSLDFYAKMLLYEEKDEPDYSTFTDLIKQGKGKVISDACEQHTQLTWRLYTKIKPYYL